MLTLSCSVDALLINGVSLKHLFQTEIAEQRQRLCCPARLSRLSKFKPLGFIERIEISTMFGVAAVSPARAPHQQKDKPHDPRQHSHHRCATT